MNGYVSFQIISLLGVLLFYHLFEHYLNGLSHPDTNTWKSALISLPFSTAILVGLIEYIVEMHIYGPKNPGVMALVGVVFIGIGLFIRFKAIFTAKQSFSHAIMHVRKPSHELITHGIYHYIRHPGYLGMFLFAVGTQIYLVNPISIVVFAAVLWKLFHDRIQIEETYLVSMFGIDYIEYRERTPTWLPFIS